MSEGRLAVVGLAVPVVVVAGYWLWDPVVVPESLEGETRVVEQSRDIQPERDLETEAEPRPERPAVRRPDRSERDTRDRDREDAAEPDRQQVVAPEPGSRPEPPPEPEPAERTYVVKPGDTLSGISFRAYGSSRYVDLIFAANRDVLPSQDALSVGQELVLPELPAEPR